VSRFHGGHDADEGVFAEINITPFTDVVLVLLIIFMVTAPLLMESRVPVKLPVTQQAAMPPEDHPTVVLTADGKIYLNDKPIDSPAALTGAIRGSILKTQDHTVVLRADAGARHGRVMECLDAAKAAGADRLAIATRQPSAENKP
jgi:biopolymer transport protein TolR